MEGLPENPPDLEELCQICILTKATKIIKGPTTDVLKVSPGFMLHMDVAFSMLKAYVDLLRLLWIYVMLIHTPLYLHPKENVCLLTSWNLLSLY